MTTNPNIDGLTGNESNPDSTGAQITVQPLAEYQSQLDPDPNHHFAAVNLQIFNSTQHGPPLPANMQGFIASYFNQQQNVAHSHDILCYFTPDKLPVLTTLATQYATFNRWFASIPGPTICNRAFAHYGTSFGQVSMNIFYEGKSIKDIYSRLLAAGHTTKLFYYDEASSTMEVVNLLQNEPAVFGTFNDFLSACSQTPCPTTASSSPTTPTILRPTAAANHRLRPASRPRRPRRRAVHRPDLQRHPHQPQPLAQHGTPHRLRRAWRNLRPRPTALVSARHTIFRAAC